MNIFDALVKTINIADLTCPFCGAKHALSAFASYTRHLVTYDNNKVHDNTVTISRYICSSCGHTHAILPPVIVPYMSFSFKFTVPIIHDYHSISLLYYCNHY